MSWGGGERNSEFRIVNSEWGHYVAVSRGAAVGVESLSWWLCGVLGSWFLVGRLCGGRNSEFRIVNSEWGHYVAVSRGAAVGVLTTVRVP